MIDTYGREINYLRLSVTDRCNLRCRYCMPAEGICKKRCEDMLSEEEMILAVEAAAALGIHKLRITGGEPLVKKNILSICRKAAEVKGINEICLTTNGVLLPDYASELRNAGVSRVNLSIDTLNEEKYRRMTRIGELSDALKGLDAALNAGFEKVKINAVLIGGFNDDEIISLAQLTQRYPVDVRFIELMPILGGEFDASAYIPGREVLEQLAQAVPVENDGGVARLYRLTGAKGNVGIISPLSADFCGQCSRLRLTADGKIKPCLHSPAEFDIRGLDRDGMIAQFKRAILAKPAGHGGLSAHCPSHAGRSMNQIGG